MLIGPLTRATLAHKIPLDTATQSSNGSRQAVRTPISEKVRPVGFEPTTRGLKGPCSAPELRPRMTTARRPHMVEALQQTGIGRRPSWVTL